MSDAAPRRIGAVVPVLNGADVLPRSIASIRAELSETDEIVVVDDGSTDGSGDVARRLADAPGTPLRVRRIDNRGPAGARNAGVAALTAPIVAFLDVDDVWPSGRTTVLRRRLDAPNRVDAVFGTTRLVPTDPDDQFWRRLVRLDAPAVAALNGAGICRREAFERIGGYDEALRFGEDFDWFLRALEAGLRIVILDCVALHYHLHSTNMSRDRAAVNRSAAVVLARSLKRRRQHGDVRPLPQARALLERIA